MTSLLSVCSRMLVKSSDWLITIGDSSGTLRRNCQRRQLSSQCMRCLLCLRLKRLKLRENLRKYRNGILKCIFFYSKDNDSLPVDNGPVIPDHEDSEEESADEKTSTNSFIPHETQGNGLTREGSLEGSKRGEELVHDHKGSVDGVTNHVYEKPPDEYVPSQEEFQRENGVRLSLEDEQEDSRGGEKLVHDNKGSVDGATNHIYENPPDEYAPSYDEIHRRDEARLSLEDEDTAVENTDERSTENSLLPHNTQENTELKREGSLEGSMSRKDAESELGSIDGITNRIYENAPDEYDPSFVEIPGNDEVRLFLGERRPSSSSSSSSDTEVGSVEFSTEFNPVIDQEDVSCAVGDAPLEGALPSNSDETPVRRTAKVRYFVELKLGYHFKIPALTVELIYFLSLLFYFFKPKI